MIAARLVPPGVDATMMAFSTTLLQLDMFTIRNLLGVFINKKFVGVTYDNLKDKYIYLTMFKTFGACLPLLYIYLLIPTNDQINAV